MCPPLKNNRHASAAHQGVRRSCVSGADKNQTDRDKTSRFCRKNPSLAAGNLRKTANGLRCAHKYISENRSRTLCVCTYDADKLPRRAKGERLRPAVCLCIFRGYYNCVSSIFPLKYEYSVGGRLKKRPSRGKFRRKYHEKVFGNDPGSGHGIVPGCLRQQGQ